MSNCVEARGAYQLPDFQAACASRLGARGNWLGGNGLCGCQDGQQVAANGLPIPFLCRRAWAVQLGFELSTASNGRQQVGKSGWLANGVTTFQ